MSSRCWRERDVVAQTSQLSSTLRRMTSRRCGRCVGEGPHSSTTNNWRSASKSTPEHQRRCLVRLLRAELELRITPHVLVDDRDSGAGLLDALTVAIRWNGQEYLDLVETLFKPLPDMHTRHGRTGGTGSFAVRVDTSDEARAEAQRYDPVPIFARYVIEMWRCSMLPWAYYPTEASGGPYGSYANYRMAMLRDGRFPAVIALARHLGEEVYERLEAAALGDAGAPPGPIVPESRFEHLRGLSLPDPSRNISDAVHANLVPDLLVKHRVDDLGSLGCPYCERFFPRAELAVVSYPEPVTSFTGVAWGCVDCTGGFAVEIPLDRMRTVDDAMR